MYANALSSYLHQRLAEPRTFDETLKRFEALRGYGLLPRGRENASLRLSDSHIAHAVLGFTPVLPAQAGHVALILGDLRPVGGKRASFLNADTLVETIATLVVSEEACRSVVHVTLCAARKSSGDEYHARILYETNGIRHTASYVSKMAHSLINNGADQNYDHEGPQAASTRQLIFGRDFFDHLRRDVAISRHLNRPFKTDWQEYNNEEERRDFHRRLGAKNSSRYLNVGVETQVTWPREPTRVEFSGHHLVLFPKTKESSHSISIDLANERLTADDARTLINRFLSLLAWCDDQYAILRDGWSGNPVPVPVPRRDMALAIATPWHFDRSAPDNEDLLQRLAYYREGLNAGEASISSFEVLSFFKVFEVRKRSKAGVKNPTKLWIASAFDDACQSVSPEVLTIFHKQRHPKNVEDYILDNNRVATAHASEAYPSDADSSPELSRLYVSAQIIKALARYYIRTHFGLSESYLSDKVTDTKNGQD